MIKRLVIENFKTVKSLDLPCKRYNLFIGDTNTGKTNVLEALTLVGQANIRGLKGQPHRLDKRVVRYGQLNDIFPGRDVTHPVVMKTDRTELVVGYKGERFHFMYTDHNGNHASYTVAADGGVEQFSTNAGDLDSFFRRYQYDPDVRFGPHWFTHLAPPDGNNLSSLLISNMGLADEVSEILAAKDLAFDVNPDTYVISLRHERSKRVAVQLPYNSLSETIKRYIFLYVALRTNQNSVLLLDEPEQNTFPFYTKHIAELMAREPSNQYFITTHNQYLLQAIIEKAPAEEVQVLATYRKDGHTHVRAVPMPEVLDMLQYDLFLNLDRLVEA